MPASAHVPVVWSFEPYQLVPIALAAAVYVRRAHTLAHRGRAVERWKIACFGAGLAVLVVALVSPLDALGEERLFWVHMGQHVLIGDIAPFLVVLGLSGPLLRPVLALRGVYALRFLTNPAIALPLWAADLALWHVPSFYDAALAHASVHAVQHSLFFACGAIAWSVVFELLPGPRWFTTARRAAFLVAMWFVSLGLSSVFLWSSHAFYAPYVHAPRTWGFSALADQRLGGGVMLLEGSFIMLGVLIWLGLRFFAETEARQQLLDSLTPRSGV